MLFLQANIGLITSLISAILLVLFFPQVANLPLFYILILTYLDISIQNIAFEYQRISLTLARIAKIDNPMFATYSIPEIQLLLSSASFSAWFFFSSFITGFLLAYLYLNSFLWVIGFLILKYFLAIFIPTYKPYKLLFNYMEKELYNINTGNSLNIILKSMLRKYFGEMPHTKKYEEWASTRYGKSHSKTKK